MGTFIELSGESDFKKLVDKFRNLNLGGVLDKTVASVAAQGRREATQAESRIVHMGRVNVKGWGEEGKPTKTSQSVYNSALGGYVSFKTGLRMMSFSFEKSANRMKGVSKYAHVALTSQMANLFENDTKPYSSSSPIFGVENLYRAHIKAGGRRAGKKFFYSQVFSAVQKAVPRGLAKADMSLSQRLAELKLK